MNILSTIHNSFRTLCKHVCYSNQAEMAHTCRGTINLANAIIHIEDSTTIVISNGGAQTFHLKAASEVERQKWIMALELAKNEAKKMADAGKLFFIVVFLSF